MKRLLTLYFLLLVSQTWAQEKKEIEKKVDPSVFPSEAINKLKLYLEDAKKIRYYYEIDGKEESYEAKFKKNHHRYSVEFDSQGNLEDVEVQVRFSQLSNLTKKSIKEYLNEYFERWKIEKIQLQYYNLERINQLIDWNEKVPLEIIVATKTNGKLEKFELQFSENIECISKRKVIRQSYEFVLF